MGVDVGANGLEYEPEAGMCERGDIGLLKVP